MRSTWHTNAIAMPFLSHSSEQLIQDQALKVGYPIVNSLKINDTPCVAISGRRDEPRSGQPSGNLERGSHRRRHQLSDGN